MAKALENVISGQELRDFMGNMSLGHSGLVEGTNSATIKTTTVLPYRIGGQTFTKAVTDNIAMTAAAAQAANTTCYYLASINASGTIKLTKGTDGSTNIPTLPENEAPVAIMKIVATNAFTSGTTDLSAAGITATWAHINYIPASGTVTGLTFA